MPSFAPPSKIVGVGRNYPAHAREHGQAMPTEPLLFLKPPSALIADGEPIRLPPASAHVEHEGEIGVVIGRRLCRATAAAARDAIFGVTCVNDVTARDLQQRDSQWTRAKGFDTFCPVGPRVVPVDAGFALDTLQVCCRVNGELRQQGVAAEMAFSIPALLAYISEIMTLEPGDLVATGTPAGVGRLNPGDVVEVEIPMVGVLRNPVVRGQAAAADCG
ncbi:MAG: fumarylacetoacetate hydrolase family protein [Deltaproteobacteria bacterium]|nr:fumarylacetoacetate hydrolase family protein [Deltaproteobacteria bacterium]